MKSFLLITQVVLSILLALSIVLQTKGSGLSATFGGNGGFIASKRGVEKVLSNATMVLAVLFIMNAISFLFV